MEARKPKGRINYCKNLFRDEERTERLIKEAKEEMEVIRDEEGRVQAIIVGVKECVIVDLETGEETIW